MMRIYDIIKKFVLFFATVGLGVILSSSTLHAYPVSGTVDVAYSSSNSGGATYHFYNIPSSVPKLALVFKNNTFASVDLVPESLSAGLSFLEPTQTKNALIMNFLQGNLSELSFKVDFTLLDHNFNWEQTFAGLIGEGCQLNEAYLGTTDLRSETPVPEPATAVLLGISMLSLAGYGKFRLKK